MRGRLPEARLFRSLEDAARLVDNSQAVLWALTNVCWAASWWSGTTWRSPGGGGRARRELDSISPRARTARSPPTSMPGSRSAASSARQRDRRPRPATRGGQHRVLFLRPRPSLDCGRLRRQAVADRAVAHARRLGLPVAQAGGPGDGALLAGRHGRGGEARLHLGGRGRGPARPSRRLAPGSWPGRRSRRAAIGRALETLGPAADDSRRPARFGSTPRPGVRCVV